MFEPWQLGMIDEAGYNGIREAHLKKVAQSLLATDLDEIDAATFRRHCRQCGVDPDCFTQDDLGRLQDLLDEE